MPAPLVPFDDDRIGEGAGDVPTDRLRTLLRAHQTTVRDLPGVDDLLYEWRRAPYEFPVLARTETLYVVAVRDHVWAEFAEALDASDAERAAMQRVHGAVAREIVASSDDDARAPHGHRPMVLVRED